MRRFDYNAEHLLNTIKNHQNTVVSRSLDHTLHYIINHTLIHHNIYVCMPSSVIYANNIIYGDVSCFTRVRSASAVAICLL